MIWITEAVLGAGCVQAALSREFLETLEVQSVLEGVAARLAIEQGVSENHLRSIRVCLSAVDRLKQSAMSVFVFAEYVRLNASFHTLILQLAPCSAFFRQLDGEPVTPFKLPDMLPLVQTNLALFQKILLLEQEQHCSIVEAIERGHGARAEYLLREHSGIAARQLSPEARA